MSRFTTPPDTTPTTSSTQATGQPPQANDDDKDIKKGILVCQGALCKCSLGSSPAKLRITTQSKYFINDAQGTDKLVATTQELQNPFEPPFFGTCQKKPSNAPACTPVLTAWKEHSKHLTADGNPLLLDVSKASCSIAGQPDTVCIVRHGQEQVLGAASVANMNEVLASLTNPLSTPAAHQTLRNRRLKPVKVVAIEAASGADAASRRKTASDEAKSSNGRPNPRAVEAFLLRVGEGATFRVKTYGTDNRHPTTEEKQQVGWLLYEGGNNKALLHRWDKQGESLELRLDEPGTYRIEASGGPAGDASCSLDVVVGENKLLSVRGPREGAARQPIAFQAVFAMPPTPAEQEALAWRVFAPEGDQLADQAATGVGTHPVTFPNPHLQAYTVVLGLEGGESVSTTFMALANDVVQLEGPAVVRPGTTVRIEIKKRRFNLVVGAPSPEAIRWYHYAPGRTGQLVSDQVSSWVSLPLQAVGHHFIEAVAPNSKAANAGQRPGERDTWKVKVTPNQIGAIGLVDKVLVGKGYVAEAKDFIFAQLTELEKTSIEWSVSEAGHCLLQPTRVDDKRQMRVQFLKAGTYQLSAKLSGKTVKRTVVVTQARVSKGHWQDGEGYKLTDSGYGVEVAMCFQQEGLGGESLRLQVYNAAIRPPQLVYEKTAPVPDQAQVRISFPIDDALGRKLVNKTGQLYFTLQGTEGTRLTGAGTHWPEQTGFYLRVGTTPRLSRLQFARPENCRSIALFQSDYG